MVESNKTNLFNLVHGRHVLWNGYCRIDGKVQYTITIQSAKAVFVGWTSHPVWAWSVSMYQGTSQSLVNSDHHVYHLRLATVAVHLPAHTWQPESWQCHVRRWVWGGSGEVCASCGRPTVIDRWSSCRVRASSNIVKCTSLPPEKKQLKEA